MTAGCSPRGCATTRSDSDPGGRRDASGRVRAERIAALLSQRREAPGGHRPSVLGQVKVDEAQLRRIRLFSSRYRARSGGRSNVVLPAEEVGWPRRTKRERRSRRARVSIRGRRAAPAGHIRSFSAGCPSRKRRNSRRGAQSRLACRARSKIRGYGLGERRRTSGFQPRHEGGLRGGGFAMKEGRSRVRWKEIRLPTFSSRQTGRQIAWLDEVRKEMAPRSPAEGTKKIHRACEAFGNRYTSSRKPKPPPSATAEAAETG